MQFLNGQRLLTESDKVNPNLLYGPLLDAKFDSWNKGNTKLAQFTADVENNWCFYIFKTNAHFKKGEALTISANATLTGPKAGNYYKATLFSSDIQNCYDDNADTSLLMNGKYSSKTIIANAASDPNNPVILLVYSGVASQTGGNTITVTDIKLEKGSIATPWIPSEKDIVMSSDMNALSARISALESKIGG